VVTAEDLDGRVGWGYSGLATEGLLDATVDRARALLGACRPTLDGLLGIEHFEERFPGSVSDTAGKAAANAIALAVWDLAGQRLGVACADLWGRRPDTDGLPCYASGFFLDASPVEVEAEAELYRSQGYRYVKMRTGLPVDEDLARLAAVQRVFPEPGAVAVDAVNSWSARDTEAFVDGCETPLLWVEDPTHYDLLGSLLMLGAPIAAGESLETLREFNALLANARIDCALLDVQRLGGPLRFLATAQVLAARGVRIGAHIYTAASAHLLACVDDPLPVEVFDWSDALFEKPPGAAADGNIAVDGPGFGATLCRDTLERHGRRFDTEV
jgi:L-alanine-DL-glutamate epimerase-like enolase superfamily enzyme